MSSPGSTASLRSANQQRVVDVLRAGGTVSRADIARQTGLAPATVSNIVRELAAAGLVATEPGSGRRGTTVELARGAGLVAGIDFGHSHVAVALGELTGTLIAEERRRIDSGHAYADGLAEANTILDSLPAPGGAVALHGPHHGARPARTHDQRGGADLGHLARVGRRQRPGRRAGRARCHRAHRERRQPRGPGRASPGAWPAATTPRSS
ncbi:MarR family winged helix-turn-helix transcriptional regulator [Nocardioides sp. B-3]|uniref:MarR family winged helix-turn-helix transcriptional regulator n=1 Tax=Nocardioides sp. B-3 TaxID=2895565 RepID=UPI00215335B9|nr:MarR family winged helix-turn-helix transcriptional regulator [Nocardioides sp. B-3]UUZ57940.1 MarR family winged helix-turn-helix transcriptional regulator [Nocardioides sp. B-3]